MGLRGIDARDMGKIAIGDSPMNSLADNTRLPGRKYTIPERLIAGAAIDRVKHRDTDDEWFLTIPGEKQRMKIRLKEELGGGVAIWARAWTRGMRKAFYYLVDFDNAIYRIKLGEYSQLKVAPKRKKTRSESGEPPKTISDELLEISRRKLISASGFLRMANANLIYGKSGVDCEAWDEDAFNLAQRALAAVGLQSRQTSAELEKQTQKAEA